MPFKNLLNKRFGRLIVVSKNENKKVFPSGRTATFWDCVCDCGNKTTVCAWYLLNGDTTSCGCYMKEVNGARGREQLKKYNKWDLSESFGKGYTNNGDVFYFDKDDFDKIKDYYWYFNSHGYVVTKINNHQISLHRLVMNPPENLIVDHINHPPRHEHKIDNRKCNLRIVTQSENSMNRHPKQNKDVIGISFNVSKQKWEAYICLNYKTTFLGTFESKEDAIFARKKAEEAYFGEHSFTRSVTRNDVNG